MKYDEHEARYHETQRRIAEVEARREALTTRHGKLKGYLDMLHKQGHQDIQRNVMVRRLSRCG